MSQSITIHHYTATWDNAMRPSAPDVGTEVRMPAYSTPDARELDDFRRVLARAGLMLEFDSTDEESGEVLYTVQPDNQVE